MKTTLLSLGFAASVAFALPSPQGGSAAEQYRVTHNPVYGNSSQPISALACGGGENGIDTRWNYKTLGDIPNFDKVGAAHVSSYNSPECGGCWYLKYKGNSLYVTAVDNAAGENLFVISDGAIRSLTTVNGVNEGIEKGTVDLDSAYEVDHSYCHLPDPTGNTRTGTDKKSPSTGKKSPTSNNNY
uniref:Cerato-platanin 11 n=1 Tax=Moniliophthora perniciosa TaxID=153609 RepID=S4UQX7_MONPR|nr:cerato-platanin 11 [Moniliophthora perniciosa]